MRKLNTMEQKINLRGDHYNLKWNSFTQNLIQVLQAKQSSAALTDVTLYCEGHFIKAHKIVLAASSVIFEVCFYRVLARFSNCEF